MAKGAWWKILTLGGLLAFGSAQAQDMNSAAGANDTNQTKQEQVQKVNVGQLTQAFKMMDGNQRIQLAKKVSKEMNVASARTIINNMDGIPSLDSDQKTRLVKFLQAAIPNKIAGNADNGKTILTFSGGEISGATGISCSGASVSVGAVMAVTGVYN